MTSAGPDLDLAPANVIEQNHVDKLLRLQMDPAVALFGAQFKRLARAHHDINDPYLDFVLEAGRWAPSRFELIDLLPLYYQASQDVERMRAMVTKADAFPQIPVVIATDMSVEEEAWSEHYDTEVLPGGERHIVWVNDGFVNKRLKHITRQLILTLPPRGLGLYAALDPIKESDGDIAPILAVLQSRDPEQETWSEPMEDADTYALNALLRPLVTYVAGHEMAHVYLRHHSQGEREVRLVGSTYAATTERGQWLRDELEADVLGCMALVDGASHGDPRFTISIDESWVGPVAFLAWMAGDYTLDGDRDPESGLTTRDAWMHRLLHFERYLHRHLDTAGFEPERVDRIRICAPALAAAIIEWRRLAYFPGAVADLSEYDEWRQAVRNDRYRPPNV